MIYKWKDVLSSTRGMEKEKRGEKNEKIKEEIKKWNYENEDENLKGQEKSGWKWENNASTRWVVILGN